MTCFKYSHQTRKKEDSRTDLWVIENIREIPIIDVVCHNPEIQGSDVPVLLSSFVFFDRQTTNEEKGQYQIGYENKINDK